VASDFVILLWRALSLLYGVASIIVILRRGERYHHPIKLAEISQSARPYFEQLVQLHHALHAVSGQLQRGVQAQHGVIPHHVHAQRQGGGHHAGADGAETDHPPVVAARVEFERKLGSDYHILASSDETKRGQARVSLGLLGEH